MIVTIDKKYLMGYYGHINEGYYSQVLKAMETQFGLDVSPISLDMKGVYGKYV